MEPISTMILWAATLIAAPAAAPKSRLEGELRLAPEIGSTVDDYVRLVPAPGHELSLFADSTSLSDPVFAELLSYKAYSEGWDGDGSVPPSGTDIDRAVAFVQMLKPLLPLPGAMLDPKGDVGLYWNTNDAYADINFDRDGTISLYLRNRVTGVEAFHDEVSEKDPGVLLDLLELLVPVQQAA